MLDANIALFVAASLAVIVAPGPDNIYVLTRGVAQGRKVALASAWGMCSGLLFHTTLAAVGLSAILGRSAAAFSGVKYAGAAYLIYLGVRALLSKEEFAPSAEETPAARLRSFFLRGLTMNLLNPKVAVFFLAFLPQFTSPATNRYGLLRRGDESHGLNQMPMTVEEFREEARCAHQLLALYTEIQERDYAAIRARYAGEGEHRYSKLHRNVVDRHFAIFQEDQESRRSFEATSEYEDYFDRGVVALESLVGQLVSNVRLRPRSYINELRWIRHEPYKPDLMLDCPDLRSAIYLQFCLMMVDNRPMRRCRNPNCRTPFPLTRKDKVYCKPGCRSTGRNYRW